MSKARSLAKLARFYNKDTNIFSAPVSNISNTANVGISSSANSTNDIAEGTNLYFTTARANTAIDARVTKNFVDALNINADALDGQQGTYYLDWTNVTNKPSIPTFTVTGTSLFITT